MKSLGHNTIKNNYAQKPRGYMRRPLKQPIKSELLYPYKHKKYSKNILMEDKRNPPLPTSPIWDWRKTRLTSLWLLPWSSHTSCGHHSEGPSETPCPCRGFLQKGSGPGLLWGNIHQWGTSLSTNSNKITTQSFASWLPHCPHQSLPDKILSRF